jgi:excisionase family DNA binding protein
LPALLTPTEVAASLRTSRKAIYAMIERGQLPGIVRIGRRVLVREDSLLDWLGQKSTAIARKVKAMSVTVRKYKRGGWQVDVSVRLPSAKRLRERRLLKVISKTAARKWGEARELYLVQHGPLQRPKEVPTLEQFAPRFLEGYARANRLKPSGIAAKETILNTHLVPRLGSKRLDAITSEQVQQLKHGLTHRAPKTVNNVLTVLNVMLKKAVEWDAIERLPCTIRLLPIPNPSASFHDFDEYERLVAAAKATDARAYLVVLLGGEAGLRCRR